MLFFIYIVFHVDPTSGLPNTMCVNEKENWTGGPAYLGERSSWLTPSTAAEEIPMNAVLSTTSNTAMTSLQLT